MEQNNLNNEHYKDPTAGTAFSNIKKSEPLKIQKLRSDIDELLSKEGFAIRGRIKLVSRFTGKIYDE